MNDHATTSPHATPPNTSPNDQRGLLLVISGPSGVGKTTITHHVEQRINAVFSVSMTTRPKTADDVEGRDYYFVTRQRFEQAIADGDLLEHADVFGNLYGTPCGPVEDHLKLGQHVILEIDVEGAVQIKRNMPEAFSIFVLPPSEEELLARLRRRQRESEDVIQKRFAKAKHEISRARACGVYDRFITNDKLDDAIEQAVSIVEAEIERRRAAEVG